MLLHIDLCCFIFHKSRRVSWLVLKEIFIVKLSVILILRLKCIVLKKMYIINVSLLYTVKHQKLLVFIRRDIDLRNHYSSYLLKYLTPLCYYLSDGYWSLKGYGSVTLSSYHFPQTGIISQRLFERLTPLSIMGKPLKGPRYHSAVIIEGLRKPVYRQNLYYTV